VSPSVEPFDEVKYKALMDGLECSEIQKGNLEFSGRIDAEYYQKQYLLFEQMVRKNNYKRMSEICHFIIGPFGSAYDTSNYVEKSKYRYIRGQDVKPFFVQETGPRFMAEQDFLRLQKYALKENDLLVSVVGTLGNACIVQAKELPAIFSCKSTAVRADSVDPYYLLTYTNSKYGRKLLLRKERGAIQKGLNLDDLKTIDVPLFSDAFQKEIAWLIKKAQQLKTSSQTLYKNAERMIEERIDVQANGQRSPVSFVKHLSETFLLSGRLDAEYYQPKYDSFDKLVRMFGGGYSFVGTEFEQVTEKCDRTRPEYPYVEIGDIDVGSGSASFNIVATDQLPTNAKIMTQRGDVLVSTVRPNRGAVAILDSDDLLVSGAFTVLRQKGNYKKEVLQALLRTDLYRDWLLRYNVGTSYPVIKDEDVLNMPIPMFSQEVQETIEAKILESFALRHKSKELLEYAMQAVEIAIEQGEDVALAWLVNRVNK